jgi:molybdopterin-guanine dinucleotide biosynthesis protein A
VNSGPAAQVLADRGSLPGFASVILAGGRGRRLGGTDKPALQVAGRSLLDTALAAAAGGPIVVVGPARELPAGVLSTIEQPSGGGPAAAVAAGFQALPALGPDALIALLAADLPGISAGTVSRLRSALRAAHPELAGAVLLDTTGRRQQLISLWRREALAGALDRRDTWHGASVRDLIAGLPVVEIPGSAGESDDIDTPDDLQRWKGSDLRPPEQPSSA